MLKIGCVGLDVHRDSIVMAVAEAGDRPAEVLKRLRSMGTSSSLPVCYGSSNHFFPTIQWMQHASPLGTPACMRCGLSLL